VVAGVGFLVGMASFLTRYWQPILHVLGVAYAFVLGFVRLLTKMEYRTIGIVTGIISTTSLVLVSYLFVREGQLDE
jgi:hypothetical protein